MSYANRDCFTSSFSILMSFISFSCQLALAGISVQHWIRVVRMSILDLDPRRKTFNLSPLSLSMMLTVGLSHMIFIMLRRVHSVLNLLEILSQTHWNISDAFSVSIKIVIRYFFYSINVCVTFIDLHMLNYPYTPRGKSHLINMNDPFNVLLNSFC